MSTLRVVRVRTDVPITEAEASVVVMPGMMVEPVAGGTFVPHSTDGSAHPKMFAVENDLIGRTIDDEYAIGERMILISPRQGDRVLVLLENGEEVEFGTPVTSTGNGRVRVGVEGTDDIVGFSREAFDMSGSSGADGTGRIVIEVS